MRLPPTVNDEIFNVVVAVWKISNYELFVHYQKWIEIYFTEFDIDSSIIYPQFLYAMQFYYQIIKFLLNAKVLI